jgi:hypothetical protein
VKVAANDLERILHAAAAAETQDQKAVVRDELSMQDRVQAFQRAEELRRVGYRLQRIRGRKNGKYREVMVTNLRRDTLHNHYAKCLVPYSQTEVDNRRIPHLLRPRVLNRVYKRTLLGVQPSAPWPVSYHVQWINMARLEDVK